MPAQGSGPFLGPLSGPNWPIFAPRSLYSGFGEFSCLDHFAKGTFFVHFETMHDVPVGRDSASLVVHDILSGYVEPILKPLFRKYF